jgi:hypothetical protein
MSMNHVEGNRTEPNGAPPGSRLERLKALRSLPGKLQAKAKENPRAALVAVGAFAFAMGGLVGSRLGRFALAAALPVVVSRALDGTLAKEFMRLATGIPEAPPT